MKVLSVSERVGSDRLGSFGIYLGFARRIIGELNSDGDQYVERSITSPALGLQVQTLVFAKQIVQIRTSLRVALFER